ncbi:MAG: peptidoglycan-binding domain-containing protein [Protaetiibacter sp.]
MALQKRSLSDNSPEAVSERGDRRHRGLTAALVVGACLIGALGGWSLTQLLASPAQTTLESGYTLVEVAEGEVGLSLNLNVASTWDTVAVRPNQRSGVVTTVNLSDGDEVAQGTVLYSVDLRPVVVAAGTIPAFRAIGSGVTGQDVAQLQQMLADKGMYSGAIDGVAGPVTAAAIRVWQRSIGVDADGTVQLGDVIFVPSLPARVAFDREELSVGTVLGGGEQLVRVLAAVPTFSLAVAPSQAALIPSGTRVDIDTANGAWEARTSTQTLSEDGQTVTLALESTTESSICGDECGTVPASDRTLFDAQVVIVEPQAGLVVPTSALATTAEGKTVVVDQDGLEHEVEVLATARGQSLIEGVDEGALVRIPAAPGSTP